MAKIFSFSIFNLPNLASSKLRISATILFLLLLAFNSACQGKKSGFDPELLIEFEELFDDSEQESLHEKGKAFPGRTRIDTSNPNYLQSKSNGLFLLELNASECDDSMDPFRLIDRIINKTYVNDTLTLDIGLAKECCVSFDGSSKIKGDTLELFLSSYGEACECICCYTVIFKFVTKKEFATIRLNNRDICLTDEPYKTYPVRFDMHGKDTINFYDKYGYKQGSFIEFKSNDDTLKYESYIDNYLVEHRCYHDNGKRKSWKILSELEWDRFNTFASPKYSYYREWDEQGNPTKEERNVYSSSAY